MRKRCLSLELHWDAQVMPLPDRQSSTTIALSFYKARGGSGHTEASMQAWQVDVDGVKEALSVLKE